MVLSLRSASGLLLAASLAAIVTVLGLEHIGGYAPCHLCLIERWAFYAAIPLSVLALFLLSWGYLIPAKILIVLCGLAFMANAGLGVYHAGAEWKFWPGPESCSATGGDIARDANSLIERMNKAQVIRCDEPALTILGISLAGYNALLSIALAVIAFSALFSRKRVTVPPQLI